MPLRASYTAKGFLNTAKGFAPFFYVPEMRIETGGKKVFYR